ARYAEPSLRRHFGVGGSPESKKPAGGEVLRRAVFSLRPSLAVARRQRAALGTATADYCCLRRRRAAKPNSAEPINSIVPGSGTAWWLFTKSEIDELALRNWMSFAIETKLVRSKEAWFTNGPSGEATLKLA